MKTNLYIATVTYRMSYYDSHDDEEFTKTHIVRAVTVDAAIAKATKYYENKTEQYSVYYRVIAVCVTEEIK